MIPITCKVINFSLYLYKYRSITSTTLVSLLSIYMIPIACKITDFSLYLFVYFFDNIIILVG